MKRKTLVLSGIIAALVLVGAALAQPGMGFGPGPDGRGFRNDGPRRGGIMRPGAMGDMMMRGVMLLDLSEEQRDRIATIQANNQKEVVRKHADLRVKEIELGELMRADSPNRSQIEAKIREIGTVKTELQILRTNCFLEVRGQLTDEQIEQLRTQRQEWRNDRRANRRAGRRAAGQRNAPAGNQQ